MFFLHAIANTFGIETKNADNILREFKIHHVYGGLIPSPINSYMEHFNNYPYANAFDLDKVNYMCNSFHYMRFNENATTQEIEESIQEAKNIIILGFGFDLFNMQKIGLKMLKGKNVFASCVGLSKTRKANLTATLQILPLEMFVDGTINDTLDTAFLNIS